MAPGLPKEPSGGAGGMAEDAGGDPRAARVYCWARVRVLAVTAPGNFAAPRQEAIVTAFYPRMREYTVNALALYLRPQTKTTEVAVVAPPRDGNE